MKAILRSLLLCLLFCPALHAEEEGEVPLGLIMPLQGELAKPGVKIGGPPQRTFQKAAPTPAEDLGPSAAYTLAEGDLIEDLRGRQKSGIRPQPDADLVKTCLQLLLRQNMDALKAGSSWKRYPRDDDFTRRARTTRVKIGTFVSSLKKQDVGAKKNRDKVSRMLLESLQSMARSMPTDLSHSREPARAPEPSAGEKRYLLPAENTPRQPYLDNE